MTHAKNDFHRAAAWIAFILERCQFPNSDALAAQFENAGIAEVCGCGCNSFGLSMATPKLAPGIVTSGHGYGLVFEADFRNRAEEGKTGSLEILLFANDSGHLSYVEIDYCGNAFPIPAQMDLELMPYHVFESSRLIRT
ncbi:hypothetical protein [Paraburkholderia sediminicola]|uniref:hypothetical protein n=1 Tax=Paraburkholderia sediminicola TaxID=458836 RepID=UPI0038BDC302